MGRFFGARADAGGYLSQQASASIAGHDSKLVTRIQSKIKKRRGRAPTGKRHLRKRSPIPFQLSHHAPLVLEGAGVAAQCVDDGPAPPAHIPKHAPHVPQKVALLAQVSHARRVVHRPTSRCCQLGWVAGRSLSAAASVWERLLR